MACEDGKRVFGMKYSNNVFSVSVIALASFLSLTPATLSAQAFGVDMGASLSKFEGAEDIGNGNYVISVPRPHSEFESYVVVLSEATGVCMVRGIGKNHNNDRTGANVRRAFKTLETALNSRYGAGDHVNWLQPRALWDGAHEWVMSIRQNERVFGTGWTTEGGAELPEEFLAINMQVRALSSDSSYIVLQYRFSNFDECDREIKAQDASGL